MTRLSEEPRYTRLTTTGSRSGPLDFTGWNSAHVVPDQSVTYPAYRYYALTLSVGQAVGVEVHTVEIQEFQPLVEAPAPADAVTARPYGRSVMNNGSGLYTVTLSRTLPRELWGGIPTDVGGYMEIWDSFKIRAAFHQGQVWSVSSFPTQPGVTPGRGRRASVSLGEVLIPRVTTIRSINAAITSISFLWCYVRHRAMRPVGDQSMIVNRVSDPDRVLETFLQPPAWTSDRDTIWFLLTIPSARIPGESRYVGLASSNTVQVMVTDSIGSALPEFCLVMPSGEILDIQQYDGNIVLPDEVPPDEWASVSVLLTVQFEEPPQKRPRP